MQILLALSVENIIENCFKKYYVCIHRYWDEIKIFWKFTF